MPAYYYYCMIDILRQIERKQLNSPESDALSQLALVRTEPMACNGFRIDTFVTNTREDIIDLNQTDGFERFCKFLEDVKLFHINLEFALDELLSQRKYNPGIQRAVLAAFGDEQIPETTPERADPLSDDNIGKLNHAFIHHLDITQLVRVYRDTVVALDKAKIEHDMVQKIVGQKTDLFLQSFEGIVCGQYGLVKTAHLIENGFRMDHEPNKGQDSYVADGEKMAKTLQGSDEYEILLAWMECDSYEMRRCFELDLFLRLKLFKKMPKWVQLETFSFLRQESKKQKLAQMYFEIADSIQLQKKAPKLHEAMQRSAQGEVDPLLQRILVETITDTSVAYSGSAKYFHDGAKAREQEAYKSRIVA